MLCMTVRSSGAGLPGNVTPGRPSVARAIAGMPCWPGRALPSARPGCTPVTSSTTTAVSAGAMSSIGDDALGPNSVSTVVVSTTLEPGAAHSTAWLSAVSPPAASRSGSAGRCSSLVAYELVISSPVLPE